MKAALRSERLPPYPLGGIHEAVSSLRLSGKDVIDFSQINPDFGAPPPAVDKAIQSLLLPHHHRYSSSQGILKLREKFCEYYRERFGVELDPVEECIVTMGVKEGMGHMLLAISNPGDQVAILTPSYPVHPAGAFLAGAGSISVPLFGTWEEAWNSNFQLTGRSELFFQRMEALFEHAWPRPKAVILNFPHNPTTATADRSFFERLVATVEKYGSYLLHDFAHAEILFESGAAPSLLSAQGAKERSVEFYSFSKSFQMPGWRVGFAVGNSELIAGLKRVKSYLDFGVFLPLQLGALAALEKASGMISEYKEEYLSRRNLLKAGLEEQGWRVAEPKAGVFVWAELPKRYHELGAMRFAEQLVQRSGVALSPGSGFDAEADLFVRFGLGEKESRIREGLRRLKAYDA